VSACVWVCFREKRESKMCRVTKCHFTRLITGLCGMLETECFFSMFDAETKKKVENGVRKISYRHRLCGPIRSDVVVAKTVNARACDK